MPSTPQSFESCGMTEIAEVEEVFFLFLLCAGRRSAWKGQSHDGELAYVMLGEHLASR